MPWQNMGANGELAGMGSVNPEQRRAFYRSIGLDDNGNPVAGAASGPPGITVGAAPAGGATLASLGTPPANSGMVTAGIPEPPAPQATRQRFDYGPPTAAPVDPSGTLFPERDVQAFDRYLSGQGGYMSPSMAVRGAPGQAVPAGARELSTDAGRYFVDAAANPLSPRGGPPQGPNGLPSFEQFRWQQMNSGMNPLQLQQAFQGLQGRATTNAVAQGDLGNRTLETNARFGPGGLESQAIGVNQGRLALEAANVQLRNSSWGRRAAQEQQLIQGGMAPDVAARTVADMERNGRFNGPSIDMGQIPGLPGFVPHASPGAPVSAGMFGPSAAPSGGGLEDATRLPDALRMPTAAAGRPAAAAGGSSLVHNPVETSPQAPAPVYEALQRQIEGQFPVSQQGAMGITGPGALVARLQQAFPALFADTPEGRSNRTAIMPYLNQRFNPAEVRRASQGTFNSPFGAIPRSDLNGIFGFIPGLQRAGGWLLDNGDNSNPDLEGRALLASMARGRF